MSPLQKLKDERVNVTGNNLSVCLCPDVTVENDSLSLRKHAYSNILKILPPKNENFQMKNSDIFHISAQNIYCGYLLEPPQ